MTTPEFVLWLGAMLEVSSTRRYLYLGDRGTDPALAGVACRAVLRPDGRCICGRAGMLVLVDGELYPRSVLRRRLRRATRS